MARFVLLSAGMAALLVHLAEPAAAQPLAHRHAAPSVTSRPLVKPRPVPPREPVVGRPLPGTFAGGVDPFHGRVASVTVLRPAVERIELAVSVNAVPAIAGIRQAPPGDPIIYRIGRERARGEGQRHDRRLHRREASADGVRIVRVSP